ncbi:DUF1846 domain-containing protein [Metamycoplasma neophronis]|uniref:DUF1846 domain-containing protein n=1 Tax=Metamycoplasma neophronis TaxID=872983 RepID=A0ABY2Z043_9BACT|nr:DUF1846 domain-containing protein [Metamycoplasma neophronis]TPR53523.1 DUF1846 domain-containing protein [Metamycoplasma neophronis]
MRPFNLKKYLRIQTSKINERIKQFGNRLYLEFGGKLFDDFHATRILPGYESDSKMQLLLKLKEHVEIVIAISSEDIIKNKMRSDIGISYDQDVLRLIDTFRSLGLYIQNVVITKYKQNTLVNKFKKRLENLGIKVSRHYPIKNYPNDVNFIISKDGFGKNDYIDVKKELIIITAPGPGSGKLAVALSQLYHDSLMNKTSGYAKFETFPVWNLALNDPINLAYEAATADLADKNMIDYYHERKYHTITTNYNRDLEAFPVLNSLFKKIYGISPYASPTDMGVNMVGFCIDNLDECHLAANKEIIRRYFKSLVEFKRDLTPYKTIERIEKIINDNHINFNLRPCIFKARNVADLNKLPATAITLPDGYTVYGKTTELMGSNSAALLNALKYLANIPDKIDLLNKDIITSLQNLKINTFKNSNPRLHLNETLIALTISAQNDINSQKALEKLNSLKGCEVHSTVILSHTDQETFAKIGLNLTQDPYYESTKLFQK